MISLEQVILLELKIESAVAKIQQLQAENDALRSKCTELTNALSVKSEQLTSFESDQNQIESGIKKALDRLSSIENSVLKVAGQDAFKQASAPAFQAMEDVPAVEKAPETTQPENQPVSETEITSSIPDTEEPSFSTVTDSIQSEQSFSAEEKTPEISFSNNAFTQKSYAQASDFSVNEQTQTESEDDSPVEYDDSQQDGLGFDIF